MHNPLLEAWKSGRTGREDYLSIPPKEYVDRFVKRSELVRQYSWAIPTEGALKAIRDFSPCGVVEMGAGTGYWASLLDQVGCDVIAYDQRASSKEDADHQYLAAIDPYYPVEYGTAELTGMHPTRTLFLCWPPYGDPMAYHALMSYLASGGERLAYVGEGWGGCTGDDMFHGLLGGSSCYIHDYKWEGDYSCTCVEKKMKMIDLIEIPQWDGIHDHLCLYESL